MPSIIAIPAFNDNYIWLIREQALAAVVDPGDAAPVLAYLAQERLALAAIVTTHHHADHVGGNLALLAQHRVPVFAPAHEAIPGATRTLVEGDRIDVPGVDVALDVLDVPGHTAGHIAYVGDIDGPVLFCGDTLFAAGCGRLFEGTAGEMWSSLGKFARLDPATRVYCAHEYTLANLRFAAAVEPANAAIAARIDAETQKRARGVPSVPSTIALELATNPFLRAREPAVRQAAEARAGTSLPRDVDVFAALRGWKNAFRG
ncbi:MAG TPA: hydroxyacylglutathione hydrolase [Candidatus Aquilonibacter sp.]